MLRPSQSALNEKPRVGARDSAGATEGLGRPTPAAYYTLVRCFTAGGLFAHRRPFNERRNQAESKPFTSCIRGKIRIWIVDSDAGRVEGAIAVGRALF